MKEIPNKESVLIFSIKFSFLINKVMKIAAKKMPIVNFVKNAKLRNIPDKNIGMIFVLSGFFARSKIRYIPSSPNVNANGSVRIKPVCMINKGVRLKINEEITAIFLLKTFSLILYNKKMAIKEKIKSNNFPQAIGFKPNFQINPIIAG